MLLVHSVGDMSEEQLQDKSLGLARLALSGKSELERSAVLHQHMGSRSMGDMVIETFEPSPGNKSRHLLLFCFSLYFWSSLYVDALACGQGQLLIERSQSTWCKTLTKRRCSIESPANLVECSPWLSFLPGAFRINWILFLGFTAGNKNPFLMDTPYNCCEKEFLILLFIYFFPPKCTWVRINALKNRCWTSHDYTGQQQTLSQTLDSEAGSSMWLLSACWIFACIDQDSGGQDDPGGCAELKRADAAAAPDSPSKQLPQQISFFSGNPSVEVVHGIMHLYKTKLRPHTRFHVGQC